MKYSLIVFISLSIASFVFADKLTPPGKKEPSKITFTSAENAAGYPGASIKIISPKPDEVLADDSVGVTVDLAGFNVAVPTPGDSAITMACSRMDPAKPSMPFGQHVHVIIDNDPYMACYVKDKPFWIPKRLAPGMHTLRVFPSRSWHESVKQKNCFAAETFYVKEKKGAPVDLKKPYLTYSRPKGDYVGKAAAQVMVDFYLANCDLASGKYSAKITVDSSANIIATKWRPYIIHGLQPGAHTVNVTLLAPDGKPLEGAWNSTQRVINIK